MSGKRTENREQIIEHRTSPDEEEARKSILRLFRESPIPENELLYNLGLYVNRQSMSRMLFMHELYKKIVDVQGIVVEFGCRWGQNLALFSSFRGIYEPYNYGRKIVGFDTFSGFAGVSALDGPDVSQGAYAVTEEYRSYLEDVLSYHEKESPVSHLRKFELVQGDVSQTVPMYFDRHPETIVALAYFDLDLYAPTRACLEALKGRVTKGSIIGFDELCLEEFPGETRALADIFGVDRVRIQRMPLNPITSFVIIE